MGFMIHTSELSAYLLDLRFLLQTEKINLASKSYKTERPVVFDIVVNFAWQF